MFSRYSTGEEATLQAIQAFDSLSRHLRSLELPLKITAVQPKSDVNRHTRVFPPLAKAVPTSGQVRRHIAPAGIHYLFKIILCVNIANHRKLMQTCSLVWETDYSLASRYITRGRVGKPDINGRLW